MTLQSCPVCKVGGILIQDEQCPQCGSRLKLHRTLNEIDEKLINGARLKSLIYLTGKPLFLLYSGFTILLLTSLVMSTFLFIKAQKMEAFMVTKINMLNQKSDQSLKFNQEIQDFKNDVNANLAKTYDLVEKLHVETGIIGNDIIELKGQLIKKKHQHKHK